MGGPKHCIGEIYGLSLLTQGLSVKIHPLPLAALLLSLLASCASHKNALANYPLSEMDRPLIAPESINQAVIGPVFVGIGPETDANVFTQSEVLSPGIELVLSGADIGESYFSLSDKWDWHGLGASVNLLVRSSYEMAVTFDTSVAIGPASMLSPVLGVRNRYRSDGRFFMDWDLFVDIEIPLTGHWSQLYNRVYLELEPALQLTDQLSLMTQLDMTLYFDIPLQLYSYYDLPEPNLRFDYTYLELKWNINQRNDLAFVYDPTNNFRAHYLGLAHTWRY